MPTAPVDNQVTLKELNQDPYPAYQRMRERTPIVSVPAVNRIFFTKAKDTKAVLDNPLLFQSDNPLKTHETDGEAARNTTGLNPTFSRTAIKTEWAFRYTNIAEQYLDKLPQGESIDLSADLCGPVAARLLTHMIGVGDVSDADMQRWCDVLIHEFRTSSPDDTLVHMYRGVHHEVEAAVDRHLPRHIGRPNKSVLSCLVNAAYPIPTKHIYENVKTAIRSGVIAPREALGTVIYGLLTNPDQLEEVHRANAWPQALEEGLRWVSPVQTSSRKAAEDLEFEGIDIPKGTSLMTILASANRDEDVFTDGDKFNVFRKTAPHQAFGSGASQCTGANLVRRTIGEIMLPMLFNRFPKMKLIAPEKIAWSGFRFRGPISLPVTTA